MKLHMYEISIYVAKYKVHEETIKFFHASY